MANLEKYKDAARKFELKSDWPHAIEALVKAIDEFEKAPDNDADLALYNRLGDLYIKVNDTSHAIEYYERVVDRYQDAELVNPAIALCNKILRLSPGRLPMYLKLGMLFAKKGFAGEAKQNLVEYADRMQKAGQIEEAFRALKKVAEMSSGQEDLWAVLSQKARAAAKTPEAKEQIDKMLAEFEAKDKATAQRKSRMSRSMITGEPIKEEKGHKRGELVFLDLNEPSPARKSAAVKAPPAAAPPPKAAPAPPPPPPPPAAPAPVPPTKAAPPPRRAPEPEPEKLEIETTAMGGVEATPSPVADLPLMEVEPASLAEPPALEIESPSMGLEPTGFGLEPTSMDITPSLPEAVPLIEQEIELPAGEMQFGGIELEPSAAEPASLEGIPLMDLGSEATPEAIAAAESEAAQNLEFMDLGEVEAPTAPTAKDLESRLKKDKSDWEAHRMLGEALLEKGDREKGIAELDTSLEGYAETEDLASAMAVVEEILRLDKNSIAHQQKRVELAYRQGDRAKLVDAYVELADALLRSDAPDKSIAVYQRVLEHDPDNVRAKSALETLAPPAPPKKADAQRPSKPAPAATPAGDYVDLGSFLLDEEEAPVMDTRMRIQDEEPTGDEQKDFQQMLSAFKKGIDANVAEEDFESHYDLGVAYKEMGLLDEAIAEFQKALRAPDGKLKSSEALGLCFFEKRQFAVTETILKRGIDFAAKGDAERVGLLYLLGRTLEEQGKQGEALLAYNRVFVVDINFQDVNQRVQALEKASV
jgi:tetratricopeptide (TPR) repeat protein